MTTVTIGRRLIPLDHIALVEPFDPASHPDMKTDKDFKARVVLIDRQSVLMEDAIETFAAAHEFRLLVADQVITNPSFRFAVEAFAPSEGFEPTKPFKTRLSWHDLDGNTQSKLLLSEPETVLAVAVTGQPAPESENEKPRAGGGRKPRQPRRRHARQRAVEPIPF